MTNINKKDVLTLGDNNKYVVVSKINYENKTYYYLADLNDEENLMFCYEDNCDMVVLEDEEFVKNNLLPLFLNDTKGMLPIE